MGGGARVWWQCVLQQNELGGEMVCDFLSDHSQTTMPLLVRQMGVSAYNSAVSTAVRELSFAAYATVTGWFTS
jgi:hypothetical protein